MEQVAACVLPDYGSVPEEALRIAREARTVAVVGASPKEERPSHQVMRYLLEHGFEVFPVNPGQREILGRKCYPRLSAIPPEVRIDAVVVFRRSDQVPPIVEEALARGVGAVWLQEGITSREAEEMARAAGVPFVSNLCFRKVHALARTA